MENKVLEQNIEQIKQYDSTLANEILMLNIQKSNLQLAQNENGEYNLLLDEIPLHSIESAINEANKIASSFEDEINSLIKKEYLSKIRDKYDIHDRKINMGLRIFDRNKPINTILSYIHG